MVRRLSAARAQPVQQAAAPPPQPVMKAPPVLAPLPVQVAGTSPPPMVKEELPLLAPPRPPVQVAGASPPPMLEEKLPVLAPSRPPAEMGALSPAAGARSPLPASLPFVIETKLAGGYRSDELSWNIASDSTGTQEPNILSELQWKAIKGLAAIGEVSYRHRQGVMSGLYFNASAQRSATISGANQDSDYLLNDRQGEFSRSNNSSDSGWFRDLSGSVGWVFPLAPEENGRLTTSLTPFVGYRQTRQFFTIRDGNQTIPATGPFSDLRSSYQTEWKGPFAGLDYSHALTESQRLRLRGSYGLVDYRGKGNWNLRTEFNHPLSFMHDAQGRNLAFNFWYNWEILTALELALGVEFQHGVTRAGNDRVFFNDGTELSTRLNEVNWWGTLYSVGLNYAF